MLEKKSSDVEQGAAAVEPVLLPMDAHRQGVNTSFHRGLLGRHIQLISIGGVIGTGLFIGSGRAITNAGPLSCVLSYAIFCGVIFLVSQGTGELATLLPIQGSFTSWAGRFIEPAAGFTTGWNYFYTTLAFTAADITAVTGLCHYWLPDTNAGIWVTVTLVVFAALNFTPVRFYGATEFWFAISKVVLILGLILMTFILMLGGNPNGDRFGFRYWKEPGLMKEYIVTGTAGRFAGFWYTFKIAAFSIGGPEFIAVCSAEAVDPRRSIPKAIKRVFWRLAIFYTVGIMCVGILVPYNDQVLINAIKTQTGVGASPWVRGMQLAGMSNVLPQIMNAVVLISALSCGNSFCYVCIRTLNALANDGRAPKIFARTNKAGVPWPASLLVLSILCLAYMTVSKSTGVVFGWFLDLASIGALMNYSWMTLTYIRFHKACKAQGRYDSLPFKGMFMPWGAYIALFFLVLVMFTNGFEVFIKGNWNTQTFITSYFVIPYNIVLYAIGKFMYRKEQGIKSLMEVDLISDVQEIDEDEEWHKAQRKLNPMTRSQRFWDWLF